MSILQSGNSTSDIYSPKKDAFFPYILLPHLHPELLLWIHRFLSSVCYSPLPLLLFFEVQIIPDSASGTPFKLCHCPFLMSPLVFEQLPAFW